MHEELIHNAAPFAAHGALAIFGAFVHASTVWREGGTKSIIDYLLLIAMSSFSGVIFSLIGSEIFGPASYVTLALAGTGGFLGVEGMTFAVNFLFKRAKSFTK